MARYTGLGAGKGWLSVRVVPSVALLDRVLTIEGVRLLVTNRRVPIDYDESSPSEIVEAWRAVVDRVGSGSRLRDAAPTELHIGLADKRTRVWYEPILPVNRGGETRFKPAQPPEFKLVETSEPVVSMGPDYIWTDGEKLSTAICDREGLFMLTFSYPRVFLSDENGFGEPKESVGLLNRHIFEQVKAMVLNETSPVSFELRGRTVRTQVRMSPELSGVWSRHAYLKMHDVSMKPFQRAPRSPDRKI